MTVPGENITPAIDTNLLQQVAAGNETAFRRLFNAYRKKIYAYALHVTENESAADEIVQDVFLKVWLHRQTLPTLINFNAWIYTIARNHIFDALKALARERNTRKELSLVMEVSANNVDQLLLNKEYAHLLEEALNRLSPQQRLIFNLSRHAGNRHADIAGQLNISRHTVKTHLVHALRTIRSYFKLHSDHILFLIVALLYAR